MEVERMHAGRRMKPSPRPRFFAPWGSSEISEPRDGLSQTIHPELPARPKDGLLGLKCR
jgi:hypothetical protein